MTYTESASGNGHTADLSLLKEMVGVRKALSARVTRKMPLDHDAVLAILEEQRRIYEAEGFFPKKALAIAEIADSLKQGTIDVGAVLAAAGFGKA